MTVESENNMNVRVTALLGGILSDGEDLFKQGVALMRCEIARDLDSARRATFLMAAGTGFGVAGLVMLCFTLVHLLSAYYPGVAVWVFFAAAGVPVAAAGAILMYAGVVTMRPLSPPANPVDAFKE